MTAKNPNRRNRIRKNKDGFGIIWVKDISHPKATKTGTVSQHRLIAEKALGKYLPYKAEVHHVDRDRSNNDNSNLVICENHAYHALLHIRQRALMECGNVNFRKCRICHKYDEKENLNLKFFPYHSKCHAVRQNIYHHLKLSKGE